MNVRNVLGLRPVAVLALVMVAALTLLTTAYTAASAPATRSQTAIDPAQPPPASSVSEGPDPNLPIYQPARSSDNAAQQTDPHATATPPSSSASEGPDPNLPVYQPPATTHTPRADTTASDGGTANSTDSDGDASGGAVAAVNEAPGATQPEVTGDSSADTSGAETGTSGVAPSDTAPVATGQGSGVAIALPSTGAGTMAASFCPAGVSSLLLAVAAALLAVAAGISARRPAFIRLGRRG